MDYKLHWSDESLKNLEEILDYLSSRWTQKEIDRFKHKLSRQLGLIIQNPYMFPVSTYNPYLRKAVLSKQTTIFYKIEDFKVSIAYLHINRKNIKRIF